MNIFHAIAVFITNSITGIDASTMELSDQVVYLGMCNTIEGLLVVASFLLVLFVVFRFAKKAIIKKYGFYNPENEERPY